MAPRGASRKPATQDERKRKQESSGAVDGRPSAKKKASTSSATQAVNEGTGPKGGKKTRPGNETTPSLDVMKAELRVTAGNETTLSTDPSVIRNLHGHAAQVAEGPPADQGEEENGDDDDDEI